MHHFMAEDMVGSLLAVCLLPLFLWVPGYALAWSLDLFGFRGRTAAFRVTLSLPLSIAVCPIATYWLGRFGSMTAVWAAYAAIGVLFVASQRSTPRRIGIPQGWLVFSAAPVWIVLAWLGITLLSLVDLQWGDRLYYATNSFDYSLRAAFTHAIGATGIPPQSPMFLPGRPVTLRYHYFWLMMCSLVNQIAPQWISARQAEIGGTFWCGLGLMALVASCLRLFVVNQAVALRRRVLVGILLLGITGLDLIPGLFFLSLYARGLMDFVLPSLESWNEYVDWFLHSVIWAPHAVAALIAAFTGFLLLWQTPQAPARRGVPTYGILGGMAFASTAGISIWVAFVFGIFLILWTIVCAWNRWWRETTALVVAGVTATALAWPYLHELQGGGARAGAAGHLLELTVRTFSLAALIPSWGWLTGWRRLILVNGALLPLNYFLEFGYFFLIGRVKWRQYRVGGKPLARQDLACVILLATSGLICTFLKSSVIGNNDLGWRGFLPAQFVLLLWSVDIWVARANPALLSPGLRQLLIVFIGIGAAGTAYDLGITRFYPVMADRGMLPPIPWMAGDRHFGERNYAARDAYEWARAATPENAVIQFNPDVVLQETPALLYADRRAVAGDTSCTTVFGGESALCTPIIKQLERLYPGGGQPVTTSVGDLCRNSQVDLFVAKDTDSVWHDRQSWVWTETPLHSNKYVRMFGCGSR